MRSTATANTSWTKSEFAPLALAPILFVLGAMVWPLDHGNLWDVFFLSLGLSVGIMQIQRSDFWPLLGILICVLWVVDVWAYTVAHPLADPIGKPMLDFLGRASMFSLGWIIQAALLIVSLFVFVNAVRGRKVVSGFLAGLVVLLMIGPGPAIFKRDTLQYSIRLMDRTKYNQAAIESLMASQPSELIEVQVVPDDSKAYPGIMAQVGQIVIVQFESEPEKFWLKNVRKWKKARQVGPRYNSATFSEPCLLLSGVMTNTPGTDYPLNPEDPELGPLPVSINAIHVAGGICAPVINETEVYLAQRDGEITMNYNLPRGKNAYVKAGSYGRRQFKIWVLDLDLYQQAKIQTAAL